MSFPLPRLIGIADKVSPLCGGHPAVPVDIRGLRFVVASWLYPLDLRNRVLVFFLEKGTPACGTFVLRNEKNEQKFRFNYNLFTDEGDLETIDHPLIFSLPMRAEASQVIIWEPSNIIVSFEYGGEKNKLGHIEFIFRDSPPLTLEQKRAIQSNPSLNRIIRLIIRCNECHDGITPFVAMERASLEASEHVPRPVWYKDLEDRFTCTCGKLSFPLRYLRDGMPSLLSVTSSLLPDGSMAVTSQITIEDAEKTLNLFEQLLATNPREEDVQEFIERHPLILAPFAARQVFFKPPILNLRAADFGVITSANDLLLIEIERPSIQLFTEKGVQRAELTHAFWQTQTWDQEITNNRAAVLHCIEGCPSEVSCVRYLVIAGRSDLENKEAVTRIRRSTANCDFITYDQLIEAVRNAVRSATG